MRNATLCTHCHIAFSWEPTILVDHNLITGEVSELAFCNEPHARWYVEQSKIDMELAIETSCAIIG